MKELKFYRGDTVEMKGWYEIPERDELSQDLIAEWREKVPLFAQVRVEAIHKTYSKEKRYKLWVLLVYAPGTKEQFTMYAPAHWVRPLGEERPYIRALSFRGG